MGKKHLVQNKPGGKSRWQRLYRAKTTQAARSNERMTGESDQTRVATDILGPFPQSESGNRYVLLLGDYFTKWIEAYAIPEFSAKTVAQKLVMSSSPDLAAHLTYIQIEVTIKSLLVVNKTRSSPYHLQSNGMIEGFNRTLIDMIAVYTKQNETDWDKHLPILTAAYQSCVHEKTGYTSNLLLLGREANLPWYY